MIVNISIPKFLWKSIHKFWSKTHESTNGENASKI